MRRKGVYGKKAHLKLMGGLALTLGGLAGSGAAWAQDESGPARAAAQAGGAAVTLAPVTVSSRREAMDEAPPAAPGGQVGSGARLGVLGNVRVMDAPLNVTSYTAQTMENTHALSVADVAALDPSVSAATARFNINEDLTIRGFAVPSADFALNGMFGLTPYWRAPLEAVEQVEVIKGPAAALFGMPPGGSVGGVVNLVPKRAGASPVSRVTASWAQDSLLGVHADIGRRFGVDQAFGVRLNLAHRTGDTAIRDQSARHSLGALGLDFRQPRLRVSADLQWSKERIDNVVRQFSPGPGLTAVPAAPDGRIAYPGLGWTQGHSGMGLIKAEYDLSENWIAHFGYGTRHQRWSAVAFNPIIQSAAGDYVYMGGWQIMPVQGQSLEAGVKGSFKTGGVAHDVALGVSRTKQDQTFFFYRGFAPGMANMYAGNTGALARTPSTDGIDVRMLPFMDTRLDSLAVADTIKLMDERLLLSLGLRRQKVRIQNYNMLTGAAADRYDRGATTPFAGVVFKLREGASLYANYVEGLSRGEIAPLDASLSNPGAVLPPYKSRQKEAGVKLEWGRLQASASVFELKKPGAGVSGNTFGLFGEQRNRGLTLALAGEAARGLRLMGGLTYNDAVISKSATAALKGKKAVGVPRWQLGMGAEWDAPFAPGLTLTGRLTHADKTPGDAAGLLTLPAWSRLDAGLRYAMRLGGTPVTWRLNVDNLLNKRYWGTSAAGYWYVGAARTVSLSASFDF